MKHPEFLTMAPGEMLHAKINLLKNYGISQKVMKSMVLGVPEIFLNSFGSLSLKLRYLERRWRMDFDKDPDFP